MKRTAEGTPVVFRTAFVPVQSLASGRTNEAFFYFFFFRNATGCDYVVIETSQVRIKRKRKGKENGCTSSRFRDNDAADACGVTERLAQGRREGVLWLWPAFAEAGSTPLGACRFLVRTVSHR